MSGASLSPTLAVLYWPEGWRIVVSGKKWGRFEFKVDAVDAAIRLARGLGEPHPVILVQEPWGELVTLPEPSAPSLNSNAVLEELRRPDRSGSPPRPRGVPPKPLGPPPTPATPHQPA